MREEIAVRWIDHLRNKGIPQTSSKLAEPGTDARCCLGVLCDIAVTEGVIPEPRLNLSGDMMLYDDYGAYLPGPVQEWAEISSSNGFLAKAYKVAENENALSLAAMNDKSLSFDTIADVIQKQWGGL